LCRVLRVARSLSRQLPMLVSSDDVATVPIHRARAVRGLPLAGSDVHVRRQPEALVPHHHGLRRRPAVQLRKRHLSPEQVLHAEDLGRWRTGQRRRFHRPVLLDLPCGAAQPRPALHAAWLLRAARRHAVRLYRIRFPGRFDLAVPASAQRPTLSAGRPPRRERLHRRGPGLRELRHLRHGLPRPV